MKHRRVNKQEISETMRFDGSFHNADGNIYHRAVSKHSSHNLSDYCTRIFTSGRYRRVYTDEAHGYPFLSNSDVSAANPFMLCKYSSRKYGFDLDAVLQPGMILTGRVGAIGQTAFVPPHWIKKNAMGSDNIIRIVTKPEVKKGFIYAFLASKMGRLILLKHSTGGVQPFITDAMVGTIPVPDFPDEFQKEIDGMIQESARLREEAADALAEAQAIATSNINPKNTKRVSGINIRSIRESHNTRFEATHFIGDGHEIYEDIISRPYTLLKNLSVRIFRPGIFKCQYVQKGVTFLGGADILLSIPNSEKQLSFSQVAKMPELLVEPGWLLVTCGGTIGNVVYIDSQLSKCVVSQHVMRIEPSNDSEVIFALLSSPIGNKLINTFTYGSVIPSVENHHIELVPIPIYTSSEKLEISNRVQKYVSSNERAKQLELDAIAKVETEIEKWGKQ